MLILIVKLSLLTQRKHLRKRKTGRKKLLILPTDSVSVTPRKFEAFGNCVEKKRIPVGKASKKV